ncbi:MAG: hypothetical protein WED10_11600 [Brumimicrobium sp.]
MKVNRHKQYNYTPRYYDERKERLNAMIKNYEKSDSENGEGSSAEQRAQLKERIQNNWSLQSTHSSQSKSANIRLVIILAALLLGAYFILNYVDVFSSEVTIID